MISKLVMRHSSMNYSFSAMVIAHAHAYKIKIASTGGEFLDIQ